VRWRTQAILPLHRKLQHKLGAGLSRLIYIERQMLRKVHALADKTEANGCIRGGGHGRGRVAPIRSAAKSRTAATCSSVPYLKIGSRVIPPARA
jgi:hypothetical protein